MYPCRFTNGRNKRVVAKCLQQQGQASTACVQTHHEQITAGRRALLMARRIIAISLMRGNSPFRTEPMALFTPSIHPSNRAR